MDRCSVVIFDLRCLCLSNQGAGGGMMRCGGEVALGGGRRRGQ
jgi:hypothetical protein